MKNAEKCPVTPLDIMCLWLLTRTLPDVASENGSFEAKSRRLSFSTVLVSSKKLSFVNQHRHRLASSIWELSEISSKLFQVKLCLWICEVEIFEDKSRYLLSIFTISSLVRRSVWGLPSLFYGSISKSRSDVATRLGWQRAVNLNEIFMHYWQKRVSLLPFFFHWTQRKHEAAAKNCLSVFALSCPHFVASVFLVYISFQSLPKRNTCSCFRYIFGGAFLFASWEGWQFLDSAYFCFITLTTIGFGDFVPAQNIQEGEDVNISIAFCSVYLLFGIALLAMSFNLVQEEVISSVRDIGKSLGIIKDEDEDD